MRLRRHFSVRRIAVAAGLVAAAILAVGVILLHHYWPFTESAVRAQLGSAASAEVRIGNFHDHYFPPGCSAENVVFTRKTAPAPLLTVRKLTVSSSFLGLFRHHVSNISAEGAYVNWTQWKGRGQNTQSERVVIDHLIAKNAVVEVAQSAPKPAVRFLFRRLKIDNLRGPGQSAFVAELQNPLPRGPLAISGHFGPVNASNPEETPFSGNYALDKADLSVFRSIAGAVSSTGKFKGTIQQIAVDGQTSSPDFEVTKTHHKQPLETRFSAVVNAKTGDIDLPQVVAQFGRDHLELHGTIARDNHNKRSAVLDINCPDGSVEDTFYPFIESPQSALAGKTTFHMKIRIPSGPAPFLRKLNLQTDFRIDDAHFTHPKTQVQVSKIAEGPRQDRPDPAHPAKFRGNITVRGGTAHFSYLALQDQGASASFWGNYDLIRESVDMHGKLKTEASLSKATHGIASVFAKILEPLFKKRPHVSVVPVKISGTYSHPKFALDLAKKM